MAQSILIIGESGSGKSTSVETLDPKETFIINVVNKSLPFRGWKSKYLAWDPTKNPTGNLYATASPSVIASCMDFVATHMPHIKNIVVDDFQYMSSFEFFDKIDEKGFEKFTKIGANLAMIVKKPRVLREDLMIFFLTHAEESLDLEGRRKLKAKTIGKMVDEKLTVEGLFTIVLFNKVKKSNDGEMKYVFATQTSGNDTCKSPRGMFSDKEVPNDLQLVRNAIIAYETGEEIKPIVKSPADVTTSAVA